MNDEKKRRLREIIVEFEEDIKDNYWEFFIRKILGECGIAGLSTVKRLSQPAKNEIDGFLKDYKTDEYQNLYDKIGTTLISYNEDSLIDRFEVPDGVTIIGDKAFKGNETIQEVVISDSVKRIGNRAFYGCKNLQKVKLGKGLGQPDSMSGSSIFYDCPKLTEIYVDSIEDIRNFKHDINPFTTSFDLYVGGILFDKDVTIQKEAAYSVEFDWILFCKSVRNVYSDSGKVSCQNGFITNYEEFWTNNMMHFPPLCVENIKTVELLKEFGREHHLDISDEACSNFYGN